MSLCIAAFSSLATVNGYRVPVVSGHPVFEGVVAVSGTSAQSDPVTASPANAAGYYVRLRADEACHIAIGANPTATTGNGIKLGAGDVEWLAVPDGQRVAVIAGS